MCTSDPTHFQHREIKKRIADRYSKTHIMQPDVVHGIQERAEEFVARCTEKPGAAADIYVGPLQLTAFFWDLLTCCPAPSALLCARLRHAPPL